jgi:hypothetical protein
MQAAPRWQGLATLASVVALGGGLAAITPGTAVAASHDCGQTTITITIAGEEGAAPRKFKEPIKAIKTEGVSCASAFKFVSALYNNHSSKTPEGYKCGLAKFKTPAGFVPEQCTKSGGRKVQFAGRGG